MTQNLIELLISESRLEEATAFLRQISLSLPAKSVERYRREIAHQAFRQSELHRHQRTGILGGPDIERTRSGIAAALVELGSEIEEMIGAVAMGRQADAFMLAISATDAATPGVTTSSSAVVVGSAYDVFLSYAHQDIDQVNALVEMLRQHRIPVWFDQRLSGGERFSDSIKAALDAARAVLVLWTRNSVTSDWVLYEARRAHAQGKHVPLICSDLSVEDLPPPYPAVLHCTPITSKAAILDALRRLEISC